MDTLGTICDDLAHQVDVIIVILEGPHLFSFLEGSHYFGKDLIFHQLLLLGMFAFTHQPYTCWRIAS